MSPKRLVMSSLAVVVLALGIAGQGGSPASADPTNTERYVMRVFDDLLGRDATPTELSSYSGLLDTTMTRPEFVEDVMATAEFSASATTGAYLQYLGRIPDSTELSVGSTLVSGGDYKELEVSLASSAEYFTLRGGTNEDFVTGVYNTILDRGPDSTGFTLWVDELSNSTSTREEVAEAFVNDAAALRIGGHDYDYGEPCYATEIEGTESLFNGVYCIFLDRPATAGEAGYVGLLLQLSGNNHLDAVALAVASDEYYLSS